MSWGYSKKKRQAYPKGDGGRQGKVGGRGSSMSGVRRRRGQDKLPEEKLTYEERKNLPDSDFAVPSQRKYPIEDATHARNALSRVSQHGTPEEKKQVCEAVHRRYPEIHAQSCPMHD